MNTFERHSVLLDLLDVHSKLIFGEGTRLEWIKRMESEMEIENGERNGEHKMKNETEKIK